MAQFGQLIGAIFMEGLAVGPVEILGAEFDTNRIDEVRQLLGDASLPPFSLPTFATYRAGSDTYLTLALVFPPGTEIESATETLAQRMSTYTSLVTDELLEDRWIFVDATSVQIDELPVALVTMQAVNSEKPLDWATMVFRRDLAFLWVD